MIDGPPKLDWPAIRSLILSELEPNRLVERIAESRRTNPAYPWTNLGFKRWDRREMSEQEFNCAVKDAIDRIMADPETRATLDRLETLGFRYLIGTYDEPAMRLFHINVEHNDAAERRVRGGCGE